MIKKRFKFNLKFKFIGEVVSRLSALIFYAAAGRLLGSEEFGLFSLAFSYACIFSIITDLGTSAIITRNLARDKEEQGELVSTVTIAKLIALPVVMLLLHTFMSALYGAGERIVRITDLLGLVAIAITLGDHQGAILTGIERIDIEANLKATWKIGALVLSILFFKVFHTLEAFILGMLAGHAIGLLVGFRYLFMRFTFSPRWFNPALLKRILLMSLPLFVGWIFVTIYNNQTNLILSRLGFGKGDIGLFAASNKLIDALRSLPVLLVSAMTPIISEAAVKDPALFNKIAVNAFKSFLVILLPFVLMGSHFSQFICTSIFGPQFAESGQIFGVAIWGFYWVFLNHLLTIILISRDQQIKFTAAAVLMTALNAILCFILIPQFGIIGGAWAMLGSEVLLLFFNGNMVYRLFPDSSAHSFWKDLMFPICAIAGALLISQIFRSLGAAHIGLFAAIFVYGAIVVNFRMVDPTLMKRFFAK